MAEVYVKNTNGHGVRDGDVRVPPGGVAKVDGDSALASYNGVEKATKAEYDKYRESDAVGPGSPSHDRHEALKTLSQRHRAEAVAAPLQVVVGDDDAPHGPPTGVITTKQAVAKESAEAKRRFADHEQIEVPEGASDIEKQQAANTRAVEEVAQELAKREQAAADSGNDSDEE